MGTFTGTAHYGEGKKKRFLTTGGFKFISRHKTHAFCFYNVIVPVAWIIRPCMKTQLLFSERYSFICEHLLFIDTTHHKSQIWCVNLPYDFYGS